MGVLERKATQQVSNVFSLFTSSTKQDQPRTLAPLPNVTNSNSSGDFFIRMSFDLLVASREYKRNEALRSAIVSGQDALDHPERADALQVFKPFQIACQSGNPEVITIAIDCLGKLFTYNYWKFASDVHVEVKQKKKEEEEQDGDNDGTLEMITFVIDTICDTFVGESTDEKVQLQIIKALQAALTNADPAFSLHGAILLKAIRTTYNIFLLSKSNDVQIVAQGTVTQMVQNVMSRIPAPSKKKFAKSESTKTNLDLDVNLKPEVEQATAPVDEHEREFKDSFKVFRTLCILSVKQIPSPEGTIELRSQPIRSKLLALSLISAVLQSHSYLFLMPAKPLWNLVKDHGASIENFKFVDAVKEFLILSLSRNSTSVILPICEISMEIFGRLWVNLRSCLKSEMAIFFTEIVLPILEAKKNIPWYQRYTVIKSLNKIFSEKSIDGGQMLVEIYLNYDCDVEASAKENIWERLMNALAKVTSQHVDQSIPTVPLISCYVNSGHGTPALTTQNLVQISKEQFKELLSANGDAGELRKEGVGLMANGILKPLNEWCISRSIKNDTTEKEVLKEDDPKDEDSKPVLVDDPTAIGYMKQRKQHIIEGIKRFNAKPKKGIQFLLDTKCLASKEPFEIAKFLLENEGLSKSMIGEYLGEGEEENIQIMHAFVEQFNFVNLGFVDALRSFLQSFRLPGEAQKIDRFMLKFAEIYLKGNPETFSSADTAYVLAYSVIMLNTDQHNSQVKRKMSKPDFLKNNRGIDGGKDLPEEFLGGIFDEIANNEIIMKDELPQKTALQNGKDASPKKTIAQTTESMAMKTEHMLRKETKKKTDEKHTPYITASHYAHVKPMFESIWMSVLTGLSTPLQECEDAETAVYSLEGVKNAIKIACLFDMELEKNALLSTLSKFTLLNNLNEMREKNFEAIRVLLDIAYSEGGHLGTSWKEVVSCISQLEKLQIFGENQDESLKNKDMRKRDGNNKQSQKSNFIEEAAAVANSQMMAISVDRIFTSSTKLSGTAIVHFVTALCEVSWDEISTSIDKEQPRMYCLQRLVEISYYNMKRIRVEWSNIWAVLGKHFNQVGCYPNTNVAFFALDKLRQLAMKFLELEELPNFKFQKDFLRPFEDIVKNNPDPSIKDMCLACIQQIIQAKSNNLKSGWMTLSATLMRVAREVNEQVVNLAFEIAKSIMKNNFESISSNSSIPDYIACLVEFCKNKKFPKINNNSIDLLKQCIQKVSDLTTAKMLLSQNSKISIQSPLPSTPGIEAQLSAALAKNSVHASVHDSLNVSKRGTNFHHEEDISIKYWMPILFGLHDIVMSCELEVRSKALTILFDTLKSQGGGFQQSFWEILSKGVLFPIFDDLKNTSNNTNVLNSKFANKEELSVWLSTTLIQALQKFVDLFAFYYSVVGFMLPNLLNLLKICLMHENEALSRIGSTCIQKLIELNHKNFEEKAWTQITCLFKDLFNDTMPTFLFFNYNPEDKSIESKFAILGKPLGLAPDRKEFQKHLNKCVVHLLAVQTLQDVLSTGPDDIVYKSIPNGDLITFLDCFKISYEIAHVFNASTELRQALHKLGYMKQLPNLLKQETMSVNSYLQLLLKIYSDNEPSTKEIRNLTQERLIPLCLEILDQYNALDNDSKSRNISAWRPVVVIILGAFSKFNDEQFSLHIREFYGPAIKLLLHDMTPDVRVSVFNILQRTGKIHNLLKTEQELTINEIKELKDEEPMQ